MPFGQPIPRPLQQAAIYNLAPSESGVYGLSNSREWIYIGETDNIRGALIAHLQDAETPEMRMHPTGFVFELCDRAKRPARQVRLVSEYRPACNNAAKHPPGRLREDRMKLQ